MSDHFNRPPAGEDPLADRLRAFGHQNAHATTLPPVGEIHRRGDRRRRNQRLATAGAALAVATIIGGVVVASQPGNKGDRTLLPATQTPTPTATTPEVTPKVTSTTSPTTTTTPSTSATATSTPSATASSNRPPKPYPGTEIAVIKDQAYLVLPTGWTSTVNDFDLEWLGRPDAKYHSLCLRDGTPRPSDFGCDLSIEVGKVLAGAEGQRVWEPGQVDGWSSNSGVTMCPIDKGEAKDYMIGGVTPTKSYADVGSKTAEKYSYSMPCQSGLKFTVAQYWLPNSHIRITDYLENSRTGDILGSFYFPSS